MKNDTSRLINLWTQEVSRHINEYVPYHATQQLRQMAALFSPGLFYYYILNFQNLHMDYVHEGTQEIHGIPPEEFSVESILNMLSPEEIKAMEKKEALAVDFLLNYLTPEDIPLYKVVYFMRARDGAGKYRTLLHQVTTLTVSESGKVEHVLGIHTDISHLGMAKHDKVSFISLNGGKSYFNVDPEAGVFKPENAGDPDNKFPTLLTNREIAITNLLAKGLNAEEIAEKLFVSFHTIKTHKKNILYKTECANTTELVARCIVEGVV